jgi:hypothetical protein
MSTWWRMVSRILIGRSVIEKPMQPGRSSATMPGRLTRSIGRVAGVRAGCLLWSL